MPAREAHIHKQEKRLNLYLYVVYANIFEYMYSKKKKLPIWNKESGK